MAHSSAPFPRSGSMVKIVSIHLLQSRVVTSAHALAVVRAASIQKRVGSCVFNVSDLLYGWDGDDRLEWRGKSLGDEELVLLPSLQPFPCAGEAERDDGDHEADNLGLVELDAGDVASDDSRDPGGGDRQQWRGEQDDPVDDRAFGDRQSGRC